MHVNGELSTRKSGLYARIAKGHSKEGQVKKIRFHHWQEWMLKEGINFLRIEWYVTFIKDENNYPKHIPLFVELVIAQRYFEKYKKLPSWNKIY